MTDVLRIAHPQNCPPYGNSRVGICEGNRSKRCQGVPNLHLLICYIKGIQLWRSTTLARPRSTTLARPRGKTCAKSQSGHRSSRNRLLLLNLVKLHWWSYLWWCCWWWWWLIEKISQILESLLFWPRNMVRVVHAFKKTPTQANEQDPDALPESFRFHFLYRNFFSSPIKTSLALGHCRHEWFQTLVLRADNVSKPSPIFQSYAWDSGSAF